jgi:hypothetical protein
MMRPQPGLRRRVGRVSVVTALLCSASVIGGAQNGPVERTFRQPKVSVEKALKQLQPALSGHLPTVEGFAQQGTHPLSRYQRPYYECNVQVTATAAGESAVRVNAKITAWYADTSPSNSGYRLLNSNGRIETDILDQLSEQLISGSAGGKDGNGSEVSTSAPPTVPRQPAADEPTISAPVPKSGASGTFSSGASRGLTAAEVGAVPRADGKPSATESNLRGETTSLEEALKNQAHPHNLVAVKKSGTAVVASPSLGAKTLFLADAQDEFEMLDFNADWVHVRISGLSRGWIWRTSLEMPEGISDVPTNAAGGATAVADLFQVSREETAQFPGDWEPLRNKDVKIISVQKIHEDEQGSGASAKLEFAKLLLDKGYDELSKTPGLSGLVLIFDSADGGMIAVATPTIRRWKAGTLNDAAMWHQCYFDPPETFTVSSVSGSR